jgi:N-acetylmuramoyl-L-alanine amidase
VSVLSRWKDRLRIRRGLEKRAESEYHAAQERLEAARRKDLHPRQQLVLAADRALAKVKLRQQQVAYAERVVKRHMDDGRVAYPSPERTRISPCKSSRNGSKPRRIVLHITVSHNRPGISDIDGILDYFGKLPTQASSHIVNDAEGHDARCVPDSFKAWTQAAYNPDSLSIEQIEFSDQRTRTEWLSGNMPQLENTALWCAVWSKAYGIPLVHSVSHGVCQHSELGAAGGGHTDCGHGYPIDVVIAKARTYAAHLSRD